MPTSHDTGYKLLFSNPLIVRDLIQGFIDDPWLQKLDFSTLEPVKGHYVSEDLRDRADDVVCASNPARTGSTSTCSSNSRVATSASWRYA